jgi:hypothetical protein
MTEAMSLLCVRSSSVLRLYTPEEFRVLLTSLSPQPNWSPVRLQRVLSNYEALLEDYERFLEEGEMDFSSSRGRRIAAAMADKPTTKAKGTEETNWGELLDQLNAGGSANFIFLKAGRARIRLVKPKSGAPFREVTSQFQQNRPKTKYLMLAVDMGAPEDERAVKGIVMPKTPFKSVVTLMTEGYDLLSPDEGHGVTFIRTGSGLDTTYNVMPSQKPQPVPKALLDAAPSLDDLKTEYESRPSRTTTTKKDGGDDEWTGEDDY